MSMMRHGNVPGYREEQFFTREEKEARALISEQLRADDARDPFMFRFTLKVMHALEKRYKQIHHRLIWDLCGNRNHPEYQKLYDCLHTVGRIYDAYCERLAYYERRKI